MQNCGKMLLKKVQYGMGDSIRLIKLYLSEYLQHSITLCEIVKCLSQIHVGLYCDVLSLELKINGAMVKDEEASKRRT